MLRVKICGVTHPKDASHVWQAGADAIGFVMVPESKRYIDTEACQKIISQLPPFITTVALFMNADTATVEQAMTECGIDVLQFHGVEDPDYCRQFGKPYIKALSMSDPQQMASMADYHDAYALLIDSHDVGQLGGTGETFDWNAIPISTQPIILAGGINPDNVYKACMVDNIVGVDLSSGVEFSPGKKSYKKIDQLMQEVLRARNDKRTST